MNKQDNDALNARLDAIMAPVRAEREAARLQREAEARWPGEELVRIVTEIRAGQKQEGQPLWNLAVNQTCDEFASRLLAFLGELRDKHKAQIAGIHADYAEEYEDCPNRYGLVYSPGNE